MHTAYILYIRVCENTVDYILHTEVGEIRSLSRKPDLPWSRCSVREDEIGKNFNDRRRR